MKKTKLIDRIIFFASLFMVTNYVLYLLKQFIWSEGVLPVVICVLVITLLPLMIILYKKGVFERLPKRLFAVLKGIYCFGLCFYVASFLFLCGFIAFNSVSETPTGQLPEKTVFVTLGAKVSADESPGIVLRRRLNRTAELMEECPEALCIVSGGQGGNEPVSEAQCMRDYLVSKGISADRIIMEDKATDTIENLRFSVALIKENGLEDCQMAVVTSNFHVPRVQFLCSRMDIDTVFYGAPDSTPLMLYITLVREYMSYCKLFLWGR